jgi:hypothetical protein
MSNWYSRKIVPISCEGRIRALIRQDMFMKGDMSGDKNFFGM